MKSFFVTKRMIGPTIPSRDQVERDFRAALLEYFEGLRKRIVEAASGKS